jgi:uncharacterized membrane protein
MKTFLRYFVQGLVVLVPGAITVLVLYKILSWFRGLFADAGVLVNQYADPFIFLVGGILVVFLVGIFASSVFAKFFLEETSRLIERIPFIRHIYSPVKDFTSAFIGNKKRFDRPVLVLTNPAGNIREIGFITDDDLSELGIESEFVAVYFPMSYAISGRLLIVPKSAITPLNVTAAEAMKYIVSGGVSEVDEPGQ